ncbi:MAG: tRNA lysidine(34) synthetase TilS [Phycisphaeraceae bacterium]|nr:MAG: tRNA lysidine(34) synthetase TilS [Phycisphaeraceae bacterium]
MPGNPEAMARKARYRALADLAREADTPWVATGHTADDQFETIIMSLIRGVGPDGMRAIARRRRLEPDLRLIRPMLHITRDEARALLERADILWCEDHTNLDTTRLRAALRHAPLAQIESIRPGASRRASYSADLIHQASLVVRDRVEQVFPKGACSWSRDSLRAERPIVLGAGLRRTALRLTQGTGADRLGRKVVAPCIRAIRDGSTEPRRFPWPRDILVTVTTHEVRMERPRRPD